MEKGKQKKPLFSFSITREEFAHVVYPVIAGVPTAILLLYFLDLGNIYRDILNHFISPIVTGVVSGFVLYMLGLRKK